MTDLLNYPFDAHALLRKKKSIRRELQQQKTLTEKRVAILGGSTTAEVKEMLELFLLKDGIQPVFYESEYNKYFEDVIFGNEALDALKPEIIYIHTTVRNITAYPGAADTPENIDRMLEAEYEKFRGIWEQIGAKYDCVVIQNNFEQPRFRPLGNLDSYDLRGKTHYVNRLNELFVGYAREHKNFFLQDIHYLASWVGLQVWHDTRSWNAYKYAMSITAIPSLAYNLANIMKAIWGKSRKCLVLDLDNTLWGGVIGDEGEDNIRIGQETAEAEAFHDFQSYVKELKERGIILAVCSKNDPEIAKKGLAHQDSVLRLDDFSAFEANWEPKHDNMKKIAKALNIGEDALVFVDDNPAEREIVRAQVPAVSVPEVGDDIGHYIDVLDKSGYFETISLSEEDLQRSQYYEQDAKRQHLVSKFKDYREFLDSLDMVAEIGPFSQAYLERITQLINKTNQFNLTTKRLTASEVGAITSDPQYITLYGRLADKFGDNGLVTTIIGRIEKQILHLDVWLMSCRVLKRDMENVIFDQIIAACKQKGIKEIAGYYFKTPKNDMVAEHYKTLGFRAVSRKENGDSVWRYVIVEEEPSTSSRPIKVVRP